MNNIRYGVIGWCVVGILVNVINMMPNSDSPVNVIILTGSIVGLVFNKFVAKLIEIYLDT